MKNEVYCKFLGHNLSVVYQSMIELGIEGELWEEKTGEVDGVLKFPGVS
jgi:hypothetical protein